MSERPQWFEDWLKDQLPASRALGTSFKRPTKSLTIPSNAGPGDARIVIGTVLPPPLDTYVVNPFAQRFSAAIIFYMGTVGDNDYAYIGVTNNSAPFVSLYFGAVNNGVIAERTTGSGFPAGMQMDTDAALNLFTVFNLPENTGGVEGSGGVMIGAGGRQDIRINPGPLKIWRDKFIFTSPFPTVTTNVYGVNVGCSIGGFVKVYDDSDLEVTINAGIHLIAATTSTGAQFGLRIVPNLANPGVFTEHDIGKIFCNLTNLHTYNSMSASISGLPSGNYNSLRVIWKRYLGTGTPEQNGDDEQTLVVRELAT